ncbi:MAG: hypothetical protein V4714_14380 [Bacteroidota bacterium]
MKPLILHPSKRFLSLLVFLFSPLLLAAQTDNLTSLRQAFAQYNRSALTEKLFVHTDRSFYIVGETIWFKIYYVDGTLHQPLDLSKVAYLELLDKDQMPVVQTKVVLGEGTGHGSLVLPPSLASGQYVVRAYTNWMKNFSPDFYFHTSVTIVNSFLKPDMPAVEKLPPAVDAQFFPEGGNLVQGLESKVAFRVTNAYGQGLAFTGALLGQHNDTLVRFKPAALGIGNFTFTPEKGVSYRAVIRDSKGHTSMHSLPLVHEQGYGMQVKDSTARLLKITVSTQLGQASEISLLTHTRQSLRQAELKRLEGGKAVFVLDKEKLGEGISHLTVFNADKQPVCERLYFKRPNRELGINVLSDKAQYATREKISLDFTSYASTQTALTANLSVSVFLVDSLQQKVKPQIESYVWLTSDLKGRIESPDYYFERKNPETDEALDNLMLTHGWRRFRWEDIQKNQSRPIQPNLYPHLPEHGGHFIVGKVIKRATGLPVRNADAYLAAPEKNVRLFISRSDSSGRIRFEMKDFNGSKEIVVQTNPLQDSTNRIEISSPFSDQYAAYPLPAFTLDKNEPIQLRPSKSLKPGPQVWAQLQTRTINMQVRNAFMRSDSARAVSDSLGFYGVPDEQYLLDAFTRFPTMEEVMREYVRGVQVRKRQGKYYFVMVNEVSQKVFPNEPLIVLDGVPVFETDKIMAIDPLKIKKIELVNRRFFMGSFIFQGIVSYSSYQSDLAGLQLDPKALVLAYEGVQASREFYSPRYDTPAGQQSRRPDLRNLLHWVPNLTTDAKGKQKLDFYSSDQVGTYAIVVQGMTKNGEFGSKAVTIEVKKAL